MCVKSALQIEPRACAGGSVPQSGRITLRIIAQLIEVHGYHTGRVCTPYLAERSVSPFRGRLRALSCTTLSEL